MEDKYFDDKLKNILENAPQFDPDQMAIQDMQRRIQILNGNGRSGWNPMLTLLMLLPLLLLLAFLWKKIGALEKALEANQIQEQSAFVKIDTLVQKRTVYLVDTIYRRIYQDRTINITSNLPFYTRGQRPSYFLNNLQTPTNALDWGDTYTFFATSQLAFPPDPFSEPIDSLDLNQENFDLNPLAPFYPLEGIIQEEVLSNFKPKYQAFQSPVSNSSGKQKIPIAYYFTPTGLKGGLNTSPIVFPSHNFGGSSYSIGISGLIDFPNNRSLEIGASLLNMKFELKEPTEFAQFPLLDPEDPADVLHEVKPNLSFFQVPIVLRQSFGYGNAFQPSLGLGLVAHKPLRQRFVYEYFNSNGEYKQNRDFRNGELSVNSFRASIGGMYSLGRVNILSEFTYQHAFQQQVAEFFPLRYWSLNVGAYYDF